MGIWFNANFILELLRHIPEENILMQLTSQSTAALVKPKTEKYLLYLLMPLRIDNYD
jgi:DNA polymerase-3 subunit beta